MWPIPIMVRRWAAIVGWWRPDDLCPVPGVWPPVGQGGIVLRKSDVGRRRSLPRVWEPDSTPYRGEAFCHH